TPKPAIPKKGVSIQIMFPCEDDEGALLIKKRIDEVIKDVTEKRYTFSISEV
ncbi:hypothetical protein LCGC14_1047200, partial [marine sediment metagenome]